MQLDLLCLADAATVDAGGKLNIIGVHDAMIFPEFPWTPHVVVAFRMVGTPSDVGIHDLDIRVVDEDGNTVAEAPPTQVSVEGGSAALGRFVLPGVLVMAPTFPAPGDYAVDVFVDRHQISSCPLEVRFLKPALVAD